MMPVHGKLVALIFPGAAPAGSVLPEHVTGPLWAQRGISTRAKRLEAPFWSSEGDLQIYLLNGDFMIVLGIILLIIGFVAKIAILWTIGIIALVAGLILALLGSVGHAVGGRRHYW
jgi:hypothetical protein